MCVCRCAAVRVLCLPLLLCCALSKRKRAEFGRPRVASKQPFRQSQRKTFVHFSLLGDWRPCFLEAPAWNSKPGTKREGIHGGPNFGAPTTIPSFRRKSVVVGGHGGGGASRVHQQPPQQPVLLAPFISLGHSRTSVLPPPN